MRRVVLSLGSLLLACGSGPDLDECEALALAACDIREAACQEHYSDVLRCVREDGQATPALVVLTADEYRDRYREVGGPVTPTAMQRAFELLGLAAEAATSAGDEVPAARYDFATREVVVVDTGDVRSQLRAISQAHADAAVDFLALDEQIASDDQRMAMGALFFGETLVYGDAAFLKVAEPAADYRARLQGDLYYGNEVVDAILVARSPDFDAAAISTSFALGFGPDTVLAVWLAGGAEAVRAGYDPLIASAAQVFDYALGEPRALAEVAPPVLPDGVAEVARGRLGGWLLHALQMRALGVSEDTHVSFDLEQASLAFANWRGDALFVVEDADGAVGLVLTVALADPEGWAPVGDDWQTTADGRMTSLALAETEALQAALTAAVAAETRSRAPAPRSAGESAGERRL